MQIAELQGTGLHYAVASPRFDVWVYLNVSVNCSKGLQSSFHMDYHSNVFGMCFMTASVTLTAKKEKILDLFSAFTVKANLCYSIHRVCRHTKMYDKSSTCPLNKQNSQSVRTTQKGTY